MAAAVAILFVVGRLHPDCCSHVVPEEGSAADAGGAQVVAGAVAPANSCSRWAAVLALRRLDLEGHTQMTFARNNRNL